MTQSDRALTSAYKEIVSMADRIQLADNLTDGAKQYFKQMHDGRLLQGRSHVQIASACLYISCRQQNAPRSLYEISLASQIDKKKISGSVKVIEKALKIENNHSISAADFIPRFCSNLDLPLQVEMAAIHIAQKATEIDIVSNRSVISIATAAIYLASQASECEFKKTTKQIKYITGVLEWTISLCYKLMLPRAVELFPDGFRFAIPIELLPPK